MVSDEGPWLDDDDQRTWRLYQAMTTVVEAQISRQLQRDSGISHGYYTILAILSNRPGRSCRMTALADATFTSQSRMSHAIAAMEKEGWVRRERCTDDSRGNLAILTDEGAAFLQKAAPAHVRQVRDTFFDHLTPRQRTALAGICETLLRGLDAERPTAAVGL